MLTDDYQNYNDRNLYPFHMPGHKRRNLPLSSVLPFDIDYTEVDGLDNLHDPRGILKEAMNRAAVLYGGPEPAYETRFLVGGSTAGILSAVYAAVPAGGAVLMGRNCHKSVYHAVEILGARAYYLQPAVRTDFDIYGAVSPAAVARALEKQSGRNDLTAAVPEIHAVVLTSPTYEGVLSDIPAIAKVCHAHGVPLIVDEAHGAHLGLRFPDGTTPETYGFPPSALAGGADAVIQSAHKTLPALTQTAFLHIRKGGLITVTAVDHALNVFETSSPSYPLMASLDGAATLLREQGSALYKQWQASLEDFYRQTASLHTFRVFGNNVPGETISANLIRDPGKLIIRNLSGTGAVLAETLRERFRLETEMALGRNVLAMTSPVDDPEAIRKLANALAALDAERDARKAAGRPAQTSRSADGRPATGPAAELNAAEPADAAIPSCTLLPAPGEAVLTIGAALAKGRDSSCIAYIRPKKAEGAVSAAYLYAYPPGVPLLVPGERITRDVLAAAFALQDSGATLHAEGPFESREGCLTILSGRSAPS